MARADSHELRDRRTVVMMSPTELERIDDWRFANRIATRADAIRQLCATALTAREPKP